MEFSFENMDKKSMAVGGVLGSAFTFAGISLYRKFFKPVEDLEEGDEFEDEVEAEEETLGKE